MAEETAAPGLSFEMHTLSSRQLRLAALGQQLRRPGFLLLLLVVASGPLLGDRFLALLIPATPPTLELVLFGPLLTLAMLVVVLLVVLLRPNVARTVRFEETEILDTIAGNPTQRRDWSWVRSFREDGGLLQLECGPPLRSLRLGTAPQRFVLRIKPETMPLQLLLARKSVRG